MPSTFVNRAGEVIRYGASSHLPHVRRQLNVDKIIEVSTGKMRKAGYTCRWNVCFDVTPLFGMVTKIQHKLCHPPITINLKVCYKF